MATALRARLNLSAVAQAPAAVLMVAGMGSLVVFAIVRYAAGHGDMFLHRADNSFEVPATYFGFREAGDRSFKAAHPTSILKYL